MATGIKIAAGTQPTTAETKVKGTLVSALALIGGLVQGVCAILVATSSVKLFLGVASVAAAMQTSRFHADIIRVPVMLVSAVLAGISLFTVWNGWRLRNLPSARWRKRPLSTPRKLGIAFTIVTSVAALVLVIAEGVVHPIAHLW